MEKIFNDANFADEVLASDKPVLVDFYADWCGPCQMMAPVIERLADEYDGTITVGKLNVDENMNTAGRYGVMSIPTFILFVKGAEAGRLIGAQDAAAIRAMLENGY